VESQEAARRAHENEMLVLRESMLALHGSAVELQPTSPVASASTSTPHATGCYGEQTGHDSATSSLRSSNTSLQVDRQEPLEVVRYRVQFGEGAIGMSFNKLDGNIVVTRSEAMGAAASAGVAEGDCIVEVNSFVLPDHFTEDGLYELLVEQPRPLTIGFQRPIFDDDSSNVDSDSQNGLDYDTKFSDAAFDGETNSPSPESDILEPTDSQTTLVPEDPTSGTARLEPQHDEPLSGVLLKTKSVLRARGGRSGTMETVQYGGNYDPETKGIGSMKGLLRQSL